MIIFANKRMRIARPYDSDTTRRFTDEEMQDICDDLWHDSSIIDAYVKENPASLSYEDLAVAASWKSAYDGVFLVTEHTSDGTRLMGHTAVFSVKGLTGEISEQLPALPTFIWTTLLPFDGDVVYAGYLRPISTPTLEELSDAFLDEYAHLVAENAPIATSDAFIEQVPRMLEERVQRDAQHMIDELEEDMQPEEMAAGIHRGELAELSGKERDDAIFKQMDADFSDLSTIELDNLDGIALKQEPTDRLSDLLLHMDKQHLLAIARSLPVRGYSKMNKQGLANALSAALAEQSGFFEGILAFVGDSAFEDMRYLYDRGGRVDIRRDEIKTAERVPYGIGSFVGIFANDDGFAFIMPKEICELGKTVDWDGIADQYRLRGRFNKFANLMVELCGIVSYDDLAICYEKAEGMKLSTDELAERLEAAVLGNEDRSYEIWDDGDREYLMHFELFDQGGGDDEAGGFSDSYVENLLVLHEGIPVRTPTSEMIEAVDYQAWASNQPAFLALQHFLDCHVPDSQNDFYFSDRVMETILDMSHGGYPVEDYCEYLKSEQAVFDNRQNREFCDLLGNMIDVMPSWENNGWSAIEVVEHRTGRKVFLDEKGKPMKVGRNDPCPCGSGKKYKHCHGAPSSTAI